MLRRDLLLAFENARSRLESLPGNSLCVFTQHIPVVGSGPPPLKLRKIVDLAPITITDQVGLKTYPSQLCFLNQMFSDADGDCGGYVPKTGTQTDPSHTQRKTARHHYQKGCIEVGILKKKYHSMIKQVHLFIRHIKHMDNEDPETVLFN